MYTYVAVTDIIMRFRLNVNLFGRFLSLWVPPTEREYPHCHAMSSWIALSHKRKSKIKSLSCSDTTHIKAKALVVAERAAVVEADTECTASTARICSRRPIRVRGSI